MSPLYPNDRTLTRGRILGSSVSGHTTRSCGPAPDVVYVHVSTGSPSRPWTRTKLGDTGSGKILESGSYEEAEAHSTTGVP